VRLHLQVNYDRKIFIGLVIEELGRLYMPDM